MRGPRPPTVFLGEAERQELDALVRQRRAPQQVALRARIVLLAAAGRNNSQIVPAGRRGCRHRATVA